nr:GAP family protein [Mycolicibacterium malmesburyense]CRL67351.1 integral membrane protein [Mycolicibacterium malmesburyense]
MWSSILALALLGTFDPWRLAAILLIISRPRPVSNLFAYWVGSVMITLPYLVIPLVLLHSTSMFQSFIGTADGSSTIRYVQIGVGVFLLVIAMVLAWRFRARRQVLQAAGDGTASPASDAITPPSVTRLLQKAQDAAATGGSPFRRLLGRVHNAWQTGAPWIGWFLGFGYILSIEWVVLVLAMIVASGATLGVQITAAVVFVIVLLAAVEIILISYLAIPVRTHAVLQRLHDWAWLHRQHLVVAFVAIVGISVVVNGIGFA